MPATHLQRLSVAPRARLIGVLFAAVVLVAACSSGGAPEVPEGADGTQDPVLVQGRDVWSSNCARCHGASGGGGAGPKLADGRAEESFPDISDMTAVISGGRNAMPSFGDSLSEDEIEAVARYVREVL